MEGQRPEAPAALAGELHDLLEVPLESLPYVDEHSIEVEATAAATWEALVSYFAGAGAHRLAGPIATGLGCVPSKRSGAPGQIGSAVPGFVVARSVAPAVLALMGQHRYSRYALIFRIADPRGGPVRLSAETRAEFPGRTGAVYRLLVISSRGHVVATTHMLRSIRKLATAG